MTDAENKRVEVSRKEAEEIIKALHIIGSEEFKSLVGKSAEFLDRVIHASLLARDQEIGRLKEALEKIKNTAVRRVEGGPTDMTEHEKSYCAAFGACISTASDALASLDSGKEKA